MLWMFRLLKVVLIVALIALAVRMAIAVFAPGKANIEDMLFKAIGKSQVKSGNSGGDTHRSSSYNKAGAEEKEQVGSSQSNNVSENSDKESSIESGAADNTNKYFLTYDEMLSLKNIGFIDKLKVVSIASEIKREDIEKLMEIAAGGVTVEEIGMVNTILKASLGEREIDELYKILDKNR